MLQIAPIVAVPGDLPRKWMSDDYLDLFVWYEADGTIHGFQLCYGKDRDERAFTWIHPGTFRHNGIDAGEETPEANRSPILTEACRYTLEPLRTEFARRATEIEPEIRALVLSKLEAFAARRGA